MCLNELIRVLKPNGKIILVENDENSEFEIIRNRHLDNRTKEYNNWILSNNFITSNKIDTYFLFKPLNEAKLCFNTIYGSSIANKIFKCEDDSVYEVEDSDMNLKLMNLFYEFAEKELKNG